MSHALFQYIGGSQNVISVFFVWTLAFARFVSCLGGINVIQ